MNDVNETLPFTSTSGARIISTRRVVAITIAYHPDPRRIGERTFITGPTKVSRGAPSFAHPGVGVGQPLADRHISRSDLCLTPVDEALELEADEAVHALLQGQSLTYASLDADILARGVVIELSRRVVLWLQSRPAPHRFSPTERHALDGESASIEATREAITDVAGLQEPVLVLGETGTGKEHVVRALHAASGREGRLVVVNAARLRPDSASYELFGVVGGAMPGVPVSHEGLFRVAKGGTLVIDEVQLLDAEVQGMLARVIETGLVRSVGADEPVPIDVRIVATGSTMGALDDTLADTLRHRLSTYVIEVAALADRREDIPRLAVCFLEEELARVDALDLLEPVKDARPWLHRSVMLELLEREWTGNVRELHNLIRQLVVTHRDADQARLGTIASPATITPPIVAELERTVFEQAVRVALRNLHRADRLASGRFSECALVADAADRPASIRTVLRDACASLGDSGDDARHVLLLQRTFLDVPTKQLAVALDLGMAYSTYRRHLKVAVERVVESLWKQEQVAQSARCSRGPHDT